MLSRNYLKIFFDTMAGIDGKIGIAELQKFMSIIGISEHKQEIASQDAPYDYDNFLHLYEAKLIPGAQGHDLALRKSFGIFDVNGDGLIGVKELQKGLTKMGLLKKTMGLFNQKSSTELCETMIYDYDMNNDGVLDFDEFKDMMH